MIHQCWSQSLLIFYLVIIINRLCLIATIFYIYIDTCVLCVWALILMPVFEINVTFPNDLFWSHWYICIYFLYVCNFYVTNKFVSFVSLQGMLFPLVSSLHQRKISFILSIYYIVGLIYRIIRDKSYYIYNYIMFVLCWICGG